MKFCNNCRHLGKQKKTHSYLCLNPKSERQGIPFAHRSTRKACDLYMGRNLPAVFSLPMGARTIEDYYDRHKGQEIWVLGLGWSLDQFPDNFFDDKISIATSYSFIAFPNSTYILNSHVEPIDWLVVNRPESLKKCILCTFPSYSEGIVWPDRYGSEPIWMKILHSSKPKKSVAQVEQDVREMVKPIMERRPIVYQSLWSIVHCAILAALIFGADRITLVGCSTRATRFQTHAGKRGLGEFKAMKRNGEHPKVIQKGEAFPFSIWRRGTSLLAELFGPQGIKIRRYYYGTGYEKVEPLEPWRDHDELGA